MPTVRIHFTAAEVEKRAVFTANPYCLVTKAKPVPGKDPYSILLCEKLHVAIPNGHFNMDNSFSPAGTFARAYVRCQHGSKSPVKYLVADLQPNAGLNFDVGSKCQICNGTAQPQHAVQNAAVAPAPAPAVPLVLPQIAPDPLRANFEGVIQALGVALNTAYANCLASPNPQAFFEEQRGAIVQQCSAVLNQHLMPEEPAVPQNQDMQHADQQLDDEERDDPPPRRADANALLMTNRVNAVANAAAAKRGRGRGRGRQQH
jgi:hypothetical protein